MLNPGSGFPLGGVGRKPTFANVSARSGRPRIPLGPSPGSGFPLGGAGRKPTFPNVSSGSHRPTIPLGPMHGPPKPGPVHGPANLGPVHGPANLGPVHGPPKPIQASAPSPRHMSGKTKVGLAIGGAAAIGVLMNRSGSPTSSGRQSTYRY